MRVRANILLTGTLLVVASSCTWVKPTPQAESVRIVSSEETNGCQKLGTITTSVKASVGGIRRKLAKVSSELDVLARNEAADMGADTIVRQDEIKNGRRTFAALRCL